MIEVDRFFKTHAVALGIDPDNINPHSVDLCLSRTIIEKRPGCPDVTHELNWGDEFEFTPGALYITDTREYVRIPPTHRGQLLLKSSTARKGLNHLMAGYLDCAFHGTITLEFVAHLPVTFVIGQRIVQMELARLAEQPEKTYEMTGRYNGQKSPTLARPEPL